MYLISYILSIADFPSAPDRFLYSCSLIQAYRLAGYDPGSDYRFIEINRDLRKLYPGLVADVMSRLHAVGANVTQDATSDLLLINDEYSATMVLSCCRQTPAGSLR